MIASFEPGRHETYAGAGLEGLADSDFPLNELINLVESLDHRGFASGDFREKAASALEKLAGRENGLPDDILSLLERWLAEHSEPDLTDKNEMLFLYHRYYQDSWFSDRIAQILSEGADENILLGLAYGASHLWHAAKSRMTAMKILCRLASHHDKSVLEW